MKVRTVKEEKERQRRWDVHFMKEAKLVSEMSKCLSRKIGAVLVRGTDRISSGYNGAPSNVDNCDVRDDKGNYTKTVQSKVCPRQRMGFKSGEGIEHCPAVHAEANTICMAAREGISTKGTTLYCWCRTPCPNCVKELINAEISRIVCFSENEYLPTGIRSKDLLEQAGIRVDYISKEEVENG
jgi:dCMP deaminase